MRRRACTSRRRRRSAGCDDRLRQTSDARCEPLTTALPSRSLKALLAVFLVACGARTAAPIANAPGPAPPLQPCAIEHRDSSTLVAALTIHRYDDAGRLVVIERDDDGDRRVDRLTRRTYDGAGRLIAIDEGERVQRFELAADGRVLARVVESRGRVVTRTVLTYDGAGRLVGESDWLLEVRYQHDAAGRVIREQRLEPGGRPHADLISTYDARGVLIARDGFDETGRIHESWEHDGRGRVVGSELVRDGAVVLRTRNTHDRAGRLIAEDYSDGANAPTGGRIWIYADDGLLLGQETRDAFDGWSREHYVYDCSSYGLVSVRSKSRPPSLP